jgi:hypothetical protein
MNKIKRGSLPIPGQVEAILGKPGTAMVAAAAVARNRQLLAFLQMTSRWVDR